ncbi:uncharacterized protein LOC143427256 [Xylocopa sonorina]|uniref:uncharacterized protein LOC143427256 n=1 Tax=Xylocopa sonorina TaxID=1818115 RepID=UPI00403A827E
MVTAVDYYTATMLFALIHRSFSAMVLPRPPSSLNYIQNFDRKLNDQKSLQNFLQNSNMETTNVNDYSLVEIELQSPDEMDPTSLQNIVHAVIKQTEKVRNDSYPNPEVVPHSILGVRDVGLTPNIRLNAINDDRRVLVGPSKFQNHDEKLYYLKHSKPKVYVNVRGRSGTFRKDLTPKTISDNDPVEYLSMTTPLHRRVDWKPQHSKKNRPLKKFKHQIDTNIKNEHQKHLSRSETKKLSRLAIVYGLDDLSTTENSMVTSSELPKQIPAPPSKFPSRTLMAQTTPVQRYPLKRTDTLPGYSVYE